MNYYVINRDDRPERWSDVIAEFDKLGVEPTRFSAVVDKPGWKGCRDSHLALIEKCRNDVMFMIFEDDVRFVLPSSEILLSVSELPRDWDCLYLGVSPRSPQSRYSKHLFKLSGDCYTTHAMLWHTRPKGAVEYILDHKDEIQKIDVYFAEVIQPKFNMFVCSPMAAIQHQYQSDTCGRSDVSTVVTNYEKYCI